ncbi:MAG: hypothetical protein ACOCRO_00590 [Halanaerobiales bacterium]
MLIEYDGPQHFYPQGDYGGIDNFEYVNDHDIKKVDYCIKNCISLIRIPFWERGNINKILEKLLSHNNYMSIDGFSDQFDEDVLLITDYDFAKVPQKYRIMIP